MAAPARFRRILVADDEPVVLELFRRCLSEAGYQVDTAPSAERARDMLEERLYDAVICDYSFPGMSGIQLLDFVRQYDRDLPFIIVTGYAGTVRCAVDAMKRGAFDYLEKPFEPEELVIVTQRALEHAKLASDLRHMRAEFTRAAGVENIIGRSKVMRDLFDLVRRVAPSNSTILLQGESGTGKELFARAIHQLSARRDGPFLALNCAVLPETLLESELFGHTKGAFTGALRAKRGLFQAADGGAIFLDEIADIPLSFQSRLLRVLQEREVRPLGGDETTLVDVRVICATNADLPARVALAQFREDLYYRIAVVPITLPPLRERREDVPLLVNHFLRKYQTENPAAPARAVSEEALRALTAAPWKGNVRELENVIERAVLVAAGEIIGPADLALGPPDASLAAGAPAALPSPSRVGASSSENAAAAAAAPAPPSPLRQVVREQAGRVERDAILNALRAASGNKSLAARRLNISRGALYNKIRALGIGEPRPS